MAGAGPVQCPNEMVVPSPVMAQRWSQECLQATLPSSLRNGLGTAFHRTALMPWLFLLAAPVTVCGYCRHPGTWCSIRISFRVPGTSVLYEKSISLHCCIFREPLFPSPRNPGKSCHGLCSKGIGAPCGQLIRLK